MASRRFLIRLAVWCVVLLALWSPLSRGYVGALRALAEALSRGSATRGPGELAPVLVAGLALCGAAARPWRLRLAVAASMLGVTAVSDLVVVVAIAGARSGSGVELAASGVPVLAVLVGASVLAGKDVASLMR